MGSDQNASYGVIDQDSEEMAEFGITRVPVDYFHYKEFRYAQLADAIAEAKRDENRRLLL